MAVAGLASELRRDTAVGVIPDNSEYPLLLSHTCVPLPTTHIVRRLPDGFWQPINNVLLVKEGQQSMADSGSAFNNSVKEMRTIKAQIGKVADDF